MSFLMILYLDNIQRSFSYMIPHKFSPLHSHKDHQMLLQYREAHTINGYVPCLCGRLILHIPWTLSLSGVLSQTIIYLVESTPNNYLHNSSCHQLIKHLVASTYKHLHGHALCLRERPMLHIPYALYLSGRPSKTILASTQYTQ